MSSKRDNARLVLSNPNRVKVIKRIFSMYVEQGKGFKVIAQTLNQEGKPSPRGPEWSSAHHSGKWNGGTIRSILINPHYVGDIVWNKRTDGKFHMIRDGHAVDREGVYGARLVPNGEADWITVRNTHKPIISRRLFDKAKQKRTIHPCSGQQSNHGKTWNAFTCSNSFLYIDPHFFPDFQCY